MDDLVYPRERTLGTITLVLGIFGWLLLIGGTFGSTTKGTSTGAVATVKA